MTIVEDQTLTHVLEHGDGERTEVIEPGQTLAGVRSEGKMVAREGGWAALVMVQGRLKVRDSMFILDKEPPII